MPQCVYINQLDGPSRPGSSDIQLFGKNGLLEQSTAEDGSFDVLEGSYAKARAHGEDRRWPKVKTNPETTVSTGQPARREKSHGDIAMQESRTSARGPLASTFTALRKGRLRRCPKQNITA